MEVPRDDYLSIPGTIGPCAKQPCFRFAGPPSGYVGPTAMNNVLKYNSHLREPRCLCELYGCCACLLRPCLISVGQYLGHRLCNCF